MSEATVDLTKLRTPFAPELVGKLPRVTCRACSDGRCGDHKKAKCAECGNWISERHIHLDYVGHADVTIRLLEVDPEWSWAPKATDADPELLKAAMASGDPEIVRAVIENAPPKFETDRNGNPVGLWIKLTVGGVTRLGVGSGPSGQNDAEKVLIGDALRNAAMRFGVAVELWAKGDRADPTAENPTASAGQADRRGSKSQSTPVPPRQNGQRPQRQAERPAAAVPEGSTGNAWLDGAMKAAPTMGAEACEAMSVKADERLADGKISKAEHARLQAILLPRMAQMAGALKPDDAWAVAFQGAADAVEAERLLDDLRDQAERREVEPGRAALVEQLAEELFPGITTMAAERPAA